MIPSPARPAAAKLMLLAGILFGSTAPLAAADPHIRGQITAIEGDVATVATTTGETVEVNMAPDLIVMLFKTIGIEDVKPGDYLSIPSVTGPDGVKQALAVNVFPEALKGAGEGVSDWDWGAESQMTNATLGGLVQARGADFEMVVSYGGAEETIAVPESTPVTSFGPDPERSLAVGDNAVFFTDEEGGELTAARVGVSENGALPPI
jgi:hypothetical protein